MIVPSAGFSHRWEQLAQCNHRTFQTISHVPVLRSLAGSAGTLDTTFQLAQHQLLNDFIPSQIPD